MTSVARWMVAAGWVVVVMGLGVTSVVAQEAPVGAPPAQGGDDVQTPDDAPDEASDDAANPDQGGDPSDGGFGGDFDAEQGKDGERLVPMDDPRRRQTSRPMPGDPGAITWTGWDWGRNIGVGYVGYLGGVVGAALLYWELTDACGGAGPGKCYEDNFISTTLIAGLIGGPLGASALIWGVGELVGDEGTITGALLGTTLGMLMMGIGFSSPTLQADEEERLLIGAVVSAITVPLGAAFGYYLSQENAVRVGESVVRIEADGEVGFGAPLPLPAPDGRGWMLPLLQGSF